MTKFQRQYGMSRPAAFFLFLAALVFMLVVLVIGLIHTGGLMLNVVWNEFVEFFSDKEEA